MTKIGLIFVESEVMREGNEQLLNGLEEGVMILQPESNDTIFINSALKNIFASKDSDSCLQNMSMSMINAPTD